MIRGYPCAVGVRADDSLWILNPATQGLRGRLDTVLCLHPSPPGVREASALGLKDAQSLAERSRVSDGNALHMSRITELYRKLCRGRGDNLETHPAIEEGTSPASE